MALAGPAWADAVIIDFEGINYSGNSNQTISGFRFSPRCSMNIPGTGAPAPGATGQSLTVDTSACTGAGANAAYLGSTIAPFASLYIDHNGDAFDFTGFSQGPNYVVLTTAFGVIQLGGNGFSWEPAFLPVPSWFTNITWLTISMHTSIEPVSPVDNLAFEVAASVVPEPGTLGLMGAALAGLLGFARRRGGAKQ
jgi:PEP-CTERM motif